MNGLCHFQRQRIETVNHPTLVGFAALRGGDPQRVLLLADGHLIRAFTNRFTQHLFGSMNIKGPGNQQRT